MRLKIRFNRSRIITKEVMRVDYPKITLRAARVNQKLSQKQAGEAIGVSRDTIQNYETGKTIPSWDKVQMIEKVYKISADYLIFGRDSG